MKKINWNKFINKVLVIKRIICGNYKHWVILNITDENLIKHIQEQEFEVDVVYYGLQKFNADSMILNVSNGIDKNDMILNKAIWQAKADEIINN